jgi:hypothetical protein
MTQKETEAKDHDTTKRGHFLPRTRCTEKELATIQQKAAALGMTQGAYLRAMALSGKVIVKQARADDALFFQLQKIGVNLNQMTKEVHATGGSVPVALSATLGKLEALLDTLIS